jgi:hypothetical protein
MEEESAPSPEWVQICQPSGTPPKKWEYGPHSKDFRGCYTQYTGCVWGPGSPTPIGLKIADFSEIFSMTRGEKKREDGRTDVETPRSATRYR